MRHAHDVGHQDLAAFGRGAQPRSLDHRRAEPVAVFERHVAHADPDAHREARVLAAPVVSVDTLLHRDGARDRISRGRIRHHQRVADRLHLGAAGPADRLAQHVEMLAAHVVGGRVTNVLRKSSRTDEIREQDRHQTRRAQDPPSDTTVQQRIRITLLAGPSTPPLLHQPRPTLVIGPSGSVQTDRTRVRQQSPSTRRRAR